MTKLTILMAHVNHSGAVDRQYVAHVSTIGFSYIVLDAVLV
ncbi:MAG: hypothetical protein ACRDE7_00200 [Sphingobacterium sp.]